MMPPDPSPKLTLPSDVTIAEFGELTEGLSPDVLVSLNEGKTFTEMRVLKERLERLAQPIPEAA